jgi:hypothetical protein
MLLIPCFDRSFAFTVYCLCDEQKWAAGSQRASAAMRPFFSQPLLGSDRRLIKEERISYTMGTEEQSVGSTHRSQ